MGGSLIVMAIVGGAVLTPLMGFISIRSGVAMAYIVPLLAYILIAFYSFGDMRFQKALGDQGV